MRRTHAMDGPGERRATERIGEMKKSQGSQHSASRPAPAVPPAPTTLPHSSAGSTRNGDPGDPGADTLAVLLVDDHAPVLRFLSAAFSSNGCEITAAGTAEEALELLQHQSYDL